MLYNKSFSISPIVIGIVRLWQFVLLCSQIASLPARVFAKAGLKNILPFCFN